MTPDVARGRAEITRASLGRAANAGVSFDRAAVTRRRPVDSGVSLDRAASAIGGAVTPDVAGELLRRAVAALRGEPVAWEGDRPVDSGVSLDRAASAIGGAA